MSCFRIPRSSTKSGGTGSCGAPGTLPLDCKAEIPFSKLAIAASGSQEVKYSPSEGSVDVIGVIIDGAPGLGTSKDIGDLSLAAFEIRDQSYNPLVTNAKNTTTVVTAAEYSALQFTRQAFYEWSPNGAGQATAFPKLAENGMLTDQYAFSFTVTNEHASAARDLVGSIVVVRRS